MGKRSMARLTRVATLVGCMCACVPGRAAAVDGALHAARRDLLRYETSVDSSSTLDTLAELSGLAHGETTTDRSERMEARFLRAAAATDLLVLARVRQEPRLQPAIEASLQIPAGSIYSYLDAELAQCAQLRAYAEPASQLRAALVLAREPSPATHLAQYRGVSGSQRDLLFLNAVSQLAISDKIPLAELAKYGEPLSADTEVAEAFDAEGGQQVAALVEASHALKRLDDAARDGDPLAVSALVERSVFSIAVPDIVVPPSPKLPDSATGTAEHAKPDLLLFVDAKGIRYGYAPSAQLDSDGNIQLVSQGEPSLPQTAALPVSGKPASSVQALGELTDWLRHLLAAQPNCKIAVVIAPSESCASFTNVRASFKRAGGDLSRLVEHNGPMPVAVDPSERVAPAPVASLASSGSIR